MKFEINDDFLVTGSAEDVQTTFVKIDSYFKTSLTETKMNGRLNVVHAFIIAGINKVLDTGIKIPTPSNIDMFIKQPRIRMFDKYLFIDA